MLFRSGLDLSAASEKALRWAVAEPEQTAAFGARENGITIGVKKAKTAEERRSVLVAAMLDYSHELKTIKLCSDAYAEAAEAWDALEPDDLNELAEALDPFAVFALTHPKWSFAQMLLTMVSKKMRKQSISPSIYSKAAAEIRALLP